MVPEQLEEPNFKVLAETIHHTMVNADAEDCWREDYIHYMWEDLMTTLYGRGFFQWFNKKEW